MRVKSNKVILYVIGCLSLMNRTVSGGEENYAQSSSVQLGSTEDTSDYILNKWVQDHPLCSKNVTAYVGQTATMYCCLARFDRDLSVSWIRIKDDVIVLTHGHSVFTTDDRIKVGDKDGIWSLQIGRVGQEDLGEYECQTNAEIKNNVVVTLSVLETSAEILGPKRTLVKEGASIKLSCQVYLGEKGPDSHYRQNAVIHWFQGQRLLDPLLEPRLEMRTEIHQSLRGWMEIRNVSLIDTGNYSCVPSYAIPDWTQVHIIHDEKSAVLHEEMSEVKVDTSSQIALSKSQPLPLFNLPLTMFIPFLFNFA